MFEEARQYDKLRWQRAEDIRRRSTSETASVNSPFRPVFRLPLHAQPAQYVDRFAISKDHFRGELDLARGSRREYLSERGAGERTRRIPIICVIGQIESFSAQLKRQLF